LNAFHGLDEQEQYCRKRCRGGAPPHRHGTNLPQPEGICGLDLSTASFTRAIFSQLRRLTGEFALGSSRVAP